MERRFNYAHRQKGRSYSANPYRLPYDRWPGTLKTEFSAYEKWRTDKFVPGRPWRRQQRPETFAKSLIEFECYFGYLVNVSGRDPDLLHLADIQNPGLLREYVTWHAEARAAGPSRFIEKTLGDFLVISRYYLKAEQSTLDHITELKAEIHPVTRDRREQWVSLATLEAVGQAEYPDPNGQKTGSIHAAMAAQRSLIIRLLVRRPLRSRNIREMRLGHNLYRGTEGWVIEFRGNELKVEQRKGRENVYRISFPADLVKLLEEFLTIWRPVLNTKNSDYVFLSKTGSPLSQSALHKQIQKAVYERTGRKTNVHLIRHIWATEYITSTQNFSVAAAVLGDKLETVLRHYAHLQTHDAGRRADEFLAKAFEICKRGGGVI